MTDDKFLLALWAGASVTSDDLEANFRAVIGELPDAPDHLPPDGPSAKARIAEQTEHNVDVVAYALYIATGGSREIESISELAGVDIEHYRKLARAAIDALRFEGK